MARLGESSRALANGNLEVGINTSGIDEIGDLARDFEHMRQSLKKMVKELEEANAGLEQRVAERTAELESSEQKIKAIIESAAEAILVVDENMEILLWNPGAAQMFGYTAEEARGRSIMEIIPEAYKAGHAAGFSNVRQTGRLKYPGVAHELSALGAGGREIPIELSLGTWEIGGKRYFSALIRDVTERKELEDKIELANRRMLEELSFARDIQMGMLPLLFPAFPERAELALDAVLEPAREVGGDFYDFYFLDENRLCLVVADVSGKGAPAALFMAVSKTLIKSRAANDFDPASILTQVNGELAENNTTSTFVTVFLAILDVTTGALQFCNAGHNPPFVKNSKGALQRLEALHGPILGVLPGLEYSKDTVILEPGDMLVMYTDGVTEAMNEKEEEYSDQRLADLLAKSGGQIPNELTLEILEDVRSHQGSAEQSDDITLLAAKYQGRVPDEKGHMEIHILNRSPEISVVEEKFHDYATGIGVPDTDRQTLSMVIDDLLNNVISYAYPEGGDHQILVDLTLRGARLVLMIEDDGIPFNPFETEQPDVGQSVEERGIGGLGIHLVRETMDEYHYQRRADKNIVILVKNLDGLNEQETAGESVNEPQSE